MLKQIDTKDDLEVLAWFFPLESSLLTQNCCFVISAGTLTWRETQAGQWLHIYWQIRRHTGHMLGFPRVGFGLERGMRTAAGLGRRRRSQGMAQSKKNFSCPFLTNIVSHNKDLNKTVQCALIGLA